MILVKHLVIFLTFTFTNALYIRSIYNYDIIPNALKFLAECPKETNNPKTLVSTT